jgi:tetratricopeptide (TPR) repeat protein
MRRSLALLIFVALSEVAHAQTLPTAPNKRNAQGKRTGEWVITYTKNWKETNIVDSIMFYRKLAFDATGKPVGKTREYYRSGALRFEGIMLEIEPEAVNEELCIWYGEKGDSTKLYFENGQQLDWKTLNQEVIKLNQSNRYNEAIPIAEKCRKIALVTLGEEHVDYAYSLNELALLYRSQSQYSKAEPCFLQAAQIYKKSLGDEHAYYATCLNNLAGLYKNQSQYNKAEPLYMQAIAIRKKALGEEHVDYAQSLNELALLYYNQSQYVKAEPLFVKALSIRKKALGEEHWSYAQSLNNLGLLYSGQGYYSKAEPLYVQAIAIGKKALGEEHLDYATSLSNLAGLYESQRHYTKAESYFLQASEAYKKALGEEHLHYVRSLNKLAELYESQGRYKMSEPYYAKVLAIHKKVLGEENPDYATSLNNLAELYRNQGHYMKAEPYFLQALAIRKKALGEEHSYYAKCLNGLAFLYQSQGQYIKAEIYFLQSAQIYKKVLGEEHPSYASSLHNLAGLYYSQDQYSKAEPYYVRASQIYKKSLGDEHAYYAASLHSLAGLYESQGQYIKAEPYYMQALQIYKKALGEEHPDYATSLNGLAFLYKSQCQYIKAELYYVQALQIYKKVLGEEHPFYASTLNDLAELYHSQGLYRKAEPYYVQSLQIERDNLLTFFEMSKQEQQEAYYKIKKYKFELGHSFGLMAKRLSSATSSYESALVTKGLQLQTLSKLLTYVRQSKDTLLQSQYEQYQAWRSQQVNPNTKPTLASQLRNQSDSLYQVMARKSAVLRNFKAAFKITAKQIQQKLKSNEAAIEFVHFHYYNGKRWTDSTYYAALVLRPGWAAPRMVYLCEQRALDSLVALRPNEVRDAAYIERIYGYGGRGPGVVSLTKAPRSLYTLLWQPIDSLLSGVTNIYYSPSGLLHRLNLSAIATSVPRQRLADKYPNWVQLRSTRELALPKESVNYPKNALLMGGIEYNLDTLAYRRANARFANHNRSGGEATAGTARNNPLNFLEYTDEEIANAGTALRKAAFKADTLRGLQASEEALYHFIQGGKSPRILHLATHGFFMEDTLTRRKRDDKLQFEKEPAFMVSNNPMLRSGLLLAGGNNAWVGKPVPVNQADGILTAAEVSVLDLRQTELVVLSACETGLGDIKGTEGVFGLQRAFKIAGAKYLLMSLWQVKDDVTSLFMSDFYKRWLQDKMSIRAAYDAAIANLRGTHRDPYSWAGFVLVE